MFDPKAGDQRNSRPKPSSGHMSGTHLPFGVRPRNSIPRPPMFAPCRTNPFRASIRLAGKHVDVVVPFEAQLGLEILVPS
jgi:hypothetical protein